MTIRRWKLTGQQLDPTVTAVVTIDGTQVFSGDLIESADTSTGEIVLASGTFELDDSQDTVHDLAVSVTVGSVLIGLMLWDQQYRYNPALTTDDCAYLFTGPRNELPQAVNDAVAARGGWGAYDVDYFGLFPGHALRPGENQRILDVRKNIMVDGVPATVDVNSPVLVSAGSGLTCIIGIPAKPWTPPQ